MSVDIRKLLKKKKLTGAEIGQILVTSDLNQYKEAFTGEKGDVLTESEKDLLFKGIEDKKTLDIVKIYVDAEKWTHRNYLMTLAHEQQAQLHISMIEDSLQMLGASEKVRTFFQNIETIKMKDGSNVECESFIEDLDITNIEFLIKHEDLRKSELENYRMFNQEINRSLYYLKGFNLAIDLIIKNYKLEVFDFYRPHLRWFENKVKELNKKVDQCYSVIESGHYKDQAFKEKKLEIYKNMFKKIDIDSLKVPEQQLKQAQKLIKTGEGFDESVPLINLLVDYKPKKAE